MRDAGRALGELIESVVPRRFSLEDGVVDTLGGVGEIGGRPAGMARRAEEGA